MKSTILIIAFIATSFSIVAQYNKIDKRLLVKYTTEEIKAIKSENPTEYSFISYCVDHAFYIGDIPEEKVQADPDNFKELLIEPFPIINFFELNIEVLENKNQYFIVKGTKKLLVVKSKKSILRELNNK